MERRFRLFDCLLSVNGHPLDNVLTCGIDEEILIPIADNLFLINTELHPFFEEHFREKVRNI